MNKTFVFLIFQFIWLNISYCANFCRNFKPSKIDFRKLQRFSDLCNFAGFGGTHFGNNKFSGFQNKSKCNFISSQQNHNALEKFDEFGNNFFTNNLDKVKKIPYYNQIESIIKNALIEEGFTKSKYYIVSSEGETGGWCNFLHNYIVINLFDINFASKNDLYYLIFTIYHEIGHLKDKTLYFLMKESLKSQSSLLFRNCLLDYYRKAEITADLNAVEMLLKRGLFNVICNRLGISCYSIIKDGPEERPGHYWPTYLESYNAIKNFLKQKGYDVCAYVNNDKKFMVVISKDGKIIAEEFVFQFN